MDNSPLRFDTSDGIEPPYASQRKPRGCLYYGCVVAIVLAIVAAILMGIAVYFTYRLMNDFVRDYGEDAPRPIPVAELPVEQIEALKTRLNQFAADLKAGKHPAPLILSASEINALIDSEPELKGVVAIDLSGEKVRGDVSFPLDRLGFPGKFINGTATFDVRVDNGLLLVTFDTLEVKGKPIPESFMAKLRMENLAKDTARNPDHTPVIDRIDRIEVKNGTLVLTPKGDAPADAALPAPEAKPAEAPKEGAAAKP